MPRDRVLVVEDHPESAEGLAVLLDMWGYDAYVAHDGAQALALVRNVVPDVAVVDIGLPDVDGVELARLLRDAARADPLFLVALTGRQAEEIEELGEFDHVLRKPVDIAALEHLLHARRLSAPSR